MPTIVFVDKQLNSGQVIPLGILSLFIITLSILILFSTSKTKIEKNQLNQAAEAAAYSGLVWQAKTLNFQAYTNRAMISNQVAIGQVTAIVSYNGHIVNTLDNIETITKFLPAYGKIVNIVMKHIKKGAEFLEKNFARFIAPLLISEINIINGILSESQKVVHAGVMFSTGDVINTVITTNDARYKTTALSKIWLLQNLSQWQQLTDTYSHYDDMVRKANVVMNSRGDWTRRRDKRIKIPFLPVRYYKRGESRLVVYQENKPNLLGDEAQKIHWQWESRDADSFYIRSDILSKYKERVPFKGQVAYVNTDDNDIFMKAVRTNSIYCNRRQQKGNEYYGYNTWNYSERNCLWHGPTKSERKGIVDKKKINGWYSGLMNYRDVSKFDDEQLDKYNSRKIRLAVEVSQSSSNTENSNNGTDVQIDNSETNNSRLLDSIRLQEQRGWSKLNETMMSAVGAAELKFERPVDRSDGKIEYANLFNPYWQVKLIDAQPYVEVAWIERGIPNPTALGVFFD